ncbi:MAG TPA: ABC transporter substrate-binding protein [Hyphomicrobiales bacterium]|nr:ABC transporter substrate-binding protein [Hyphomicrobiales bacterium]
MTSPQRLTTAVAACLALVAAAALAPARAADAVPVRIGIIGSSGQAEVTEAIKEFGIDKKYGLDVQAVDYAQPGQQYTLFRGHTIDVAAAGNFVDVLRQRKAGLKLRAFHGYQGYGNQIVVKADSPIKAFTDLKGKKVGEFGPTFLDWLIVRAAGKKAYGIDLQNDATLVQGSPPLLNQFLARGQVDATLQFISLTMGPLLRGEQRVVTDLPSLMRAADFDPQSFYVVWIVDEAWSNAHPGALAKLDAVLDEAYEKLKTDDAIWTSLAAKVNIHDSKLAAAYRDTERRLDNPPYKASLIAPTQKLLDALVAISGEKAVGVTKVDPDAFWFPAKKP